MLGHSSGGPYAVACAALLPGRVRGALVSAGAADAAWLGSREGYPQVELDIMDSASEEAAVAWCSERFGADGSGFFDADPFEWPASDAAALEDEAFGAHLEATMGEAFRQGIAGYVQDVYVQGRPSPFDPGRIAVPVDVVHGDADTLVPIAHSRHTAESIPGAQFHELPGHGHLSIMFEWPRLLGELVRRAG